MGYRILALDIDGTLLDPYGNLTSGVREAVTAARRRGLLVILCTGRRFRTALPWARELGLSGAIVVNNGALVKDIDSGKTLRHNYLAADEYPEVIGCVRRHGCPLVYVDSYHEQVDVITERGSNVHPFQREYLADNEEYVQTVDDLHERERPDVIMVSTMADEATLLSLRAEANAELGSRVHTHILINKNYRGGILEFLSPKSGKWSALQAFAAQLQIGSQEIIAVGDDNNDIEMIRQAGFGMAMGNSNPEVKAAADRVVRSNAEGGAVDAIENALLMTDRAPS
jgi:Cof subfamily protein (haloacid dehalogenase superfamily)